MCGRDGAARCVAPVRAMPEKFSHVDEVLTVGEGQFAPVSAEVWGYEVSGLKVVQSWLAGRMLQRRGRTSSPLDALRPEAWSEALTAELLELLWVLERSLVLHRGQAEIFGQIVGGEVVSANELRAPSAEERAEPRTRCEPSSR
ncbi:type ISP restriction/modification enzyme [Nannocystis pusilla]|uniref:type ISP restriction/modification enzyme n=1 Tax=Nannocystis pusilla TaxID=889268 RepID=UPI003B7E305E